MRGATTVEADTRNGIRGGVRLGPVQDRSPEAVARLWTLPWGVWHGLLEVLDGTEALSPAVDCLLLMDETP